MRISKQVIKIMKRFITKEPPETGGILGSSNGDLINNIILDYPSVVTAKPCIYMPNVDFLNEKIANWQENNISFKGVFHTHFAGIKTLSCGDKKYITEIMIAMPSEIESLYFPIYVLPDRQIVVYIARKIGSVIEISSEDLLIE